MINYYKGSTEHPYHLSIGAVVVNEEGKVCCHYFTTLTHRHFKDFKNFYILMRETMEMGESIEETLHRGLMEEFGITGEIVTYVGSLVGNFPSVPRGNVMIEKTTLYFLVKMKTMDISLRSQEDAEKESEIQWQEPDFLIAKMKEQGKTYNITLDESEVVERAKPLIVNLTK